MKNYLTKHTYNILFVFTGFIMFALSSIIGFDGLLGQDSYEYLRYSGRVKNYILLGESPGDFIWPITYPTLVALLDLIINNLKVSAQLISLLSFIGCNIVLFKFLKLLHAKTNQFHLFLYVFIFLVFSPYFLRFGLTSMSDSLGAFFVLNTFYYLFLYQIKQKQSSLYYVVLFSGLSVTTRNSSIILVLIPLVISGYHLLKNKNFKLIVLSIITGVFFLIPTLVSHKSQLIGDGMSFFNFNLLNLFKFKTEGSDGSFNNTVPNLIYAFYGFFHPTFLFLGGLFMGIIIYKKIKIDKIILVSLFVFSVFIGAFYFQNKRFFIVQFPLVLVFFYGAFNFITISFKSTKMRYSFLLLSLIINILLSAYTLKKAYKIQQRDVELAHKMEPYQGKILYTFEVESSLKARGISLTYNNLWEKEYLSYDKGSFVLFNEQKFKQQWDGHLLMKNWNHLIENYNLVEVNNFNEGWFLYEIN